MKKTHSPGFQVHFPQKKSCFPKKNTISDEIILLLSKKSIGNGENHFFHNTAFVSLPLISPFQG